MNILILTALYPPLGANGHDERCRQVVDALTLRGHRLQVLTSNHRLPPMGVTGERGVYRQLMLQDVEDSESLLGHSYAQTFRRELSQAQIVYDRIERFEPDAVYVWNMHGLSKSLLFSLQAQGIPLVYDLHSDWLSSAVFERDPWWSWWRRNQSVRSKCYQWYLRMIGSARRALRNCPLGTVTALDLSNASVCSESLRDDLVAAGVTQAAAVPVLYPALNVSRLSPKTNYRSARKFMWAGHLNAAKAPAVALEAVEILKTRGVDVTLDFYGMGGARERKAMRHLIDRAGLGDSVRMLGIGPGELISKYAGYDALLFTSCCNDPFPVTPLEAMLSGLPCVLARDGGITEIIEDGESALLYDAGDAEALADAMVRLIDLPDGGAEIAKNCVGRLHVQHSLSIVVERIEALISASILAQDVPTSDVSRI